MWRYSSFAYCCLLVPTIFHTTLKLTTMYYSTNCPHWSKAGLAGHCTLSLRQHFCCCCLISKQRLGLNSSSKTSQGVFFWFFVKSKKEFARTIFVFLAILAKNDGFDNRDTLAIKSNTNVTLMCAYKFKGIFQKLFVRTSFFLYLEFRSIWIVSDYE